MQGINRSRHIHLMKALLQLEEFVSQGEVDHICLEEVTAYSTELDSMYREYNKLLCDLEQHIIAYEELHRKVKIQYLGRKLKALRRTTPQEDTAFALLLTETLRSYGT